MLTIFGAKSARRLRHESTLVVHMDWVFYFFSVLLPQLTVILIIPQFKDKFCQWLTISDFEILPLRVVELLLADTLGEMGDGRNFCFINLY